ncbi:MAG: hypothetical protein LE168_05095 [Endomicrobium sp.]|nr:hypothetical protein [Endomicrobium sp.]
MPKISGVVGKFKVLIGSLAQSDMSDNDYAQIIIITHNLQGKFERALKQINATKSIVKSKVVKIKMEI